MKVIRLALFGGLAASLLAGSACSRKVQAKVVPELPPLEVPAPPPRNVEAVDLPLEPPVTQVEEPAPPPAPPRPRPTPPVTQRTEPKPDPRAEQPAEARPTDDPRATPPASLQTTPSGREAQVERSINAMLTAAGSNLNRVNYVGLNADARLQYDQAKSFITQAQDALRRKNLVFAHNLADKANVLAAQLAGR